MNNNLFSFLWAHIVNHSGVLLFTLYQKFVIPYLVKKMKQKDCIQVVFVIEELGSWKTENLYIDMLNNTRFSPILVIVPEVSAKYANAILKQYLDHKQYDYFELKPHEKIWKLFHPDIIFYQKPYGGIIPDEHFFQYNMKSLFCYVPYCFRNRCHPGLNKIIFTFYAWQVYAENVFVINELKPILLDKAKNMIATGLPIMDDLLKEKTNYPNQWKAEGSKKKCIIYAPHHTISSENFKSPSPYDYSTFLQYADYMIELAKKYSNVQWAFKPHPLLKRKLYKVWGVNKTDAYYKKWEDMKNTQLEEGEYMGLFKHSDAMIHDCASFKIEYLYTHNPVLYLVNDEQEFDYPNWQTREALKLHYLAKSSNDIENFVQNVIKGVDSLKEEREMFVQKYLTPPNAKRACENIINSILGKEEYA